MLCVVFFGGLKSMQICSQRMRYLKSGLEPMRERPGWTNATRMAQKSQPNKTRDFEAEKKESSRAFL